MWHLTDIFYDLNCYMVAPVRFELTSPAPKASMIDHYTTGLAEMLIPVRIYITISGRSS
jgi:hypothetical protein